jgi:hypothetical protein
VFGRVAATEVEVAVGVEQERLIDGGVGAIEFEVRARSGHHQTNVLATPNARRKRCTRATNGAVASNARGDRPPGDT